MNWIGYIIRWCGSLKKRVSHTSHTPVIYRYDDDHNHQWMMISDYFRPIFSLVFFLVALSRITEFISKPEKKEMKSPDYKAHTHTHTHDQNNKKLSWFLIWFQILNLNFFGCSFLKESIILIWFFLVRKIKEKFPYVFSFIYETLSLWLLTRLLYVSVDGFHPNDNKQIKRKISNNNNVLAIKTIRLYSHQLIMVALFIHENFFLFIQFKQRQRRYDYLTDWLTDWLNEWMNDFCVYVLKEDPDSFNILAKKEEKSYQDSSGFSVDIYSSEKANFTWKNCLDSLIIYFSLLLSYGMVNWTIFFHFRCFISVII